MIRETIRDSTQILNRHKRDRLKLISYPGKETYKRGFKIVKTVLKNLTKGYFLFFQKALIHFK